VLGRVCASCVVIALTASVSADPRVVVMRRRRSDLHAARHVVRQ
jgi:hypothetical protein